MFLVNKEFSKESFFLRVMEKRYPLFQDKKKKDYLKKMHYLLLLEEKDYPYIPTKNFDPTAIFKYWGTNIWSYGLREAIFYGEKHYIDHMLKKSLYKHGFFLKFAALKGNCELIEFFLNSKQIIEQKDLDDSLGLAASENQIQAIELLISKGARNYQNALEWSARNAHLHLVQFFMHKLKPPYNLENAKLFAELSRNYEVYEYITQF
jgi:hypothetical protein